MSASMVKIEGVADPKTRLAYIPVKDIRENRIRLRGVDRENEQFISTAASIKQNGVLTPISVREIPDPDNPNGILYGLVDGLQRWTGAKDAGLETIPAHVINIADGQVLEAQILANVHKVETRPAEYSAALEHYIGSNPTMTYRELANRLNKSETWLSQRLSLNNLDPDIATLVDEGKIVVSNAYALTSLPPEVQKTYAERAMTESTVLFAPSMKKVAQEIRKAQREGREVKHEFEPHPHLQKVADIVAESKDPTFVKSLLVNSNITDPLEAAKLALSWVVHLDPVSVAKGKADWEAKQAENNAAKEQRKKDREAKKAAEAAAAAANINV